MIKQLSTDEWIPIINAEMIANFDEYILSQSITDNEKIICMIGNPDRFKDESVRTEYEVLKEKIQRDTVSYERKIENETIL